jgi:hypothetical protein
MLTIILSLFISTASAKDHPDDTHNGQIIGRPAVSIKCAGIDVNVEHMQSEDLMQFQRACVESERTRADYRVAMAGIARNTPTISDGDMIATGDAAVATAVYGQGGQLGFAGAYGYGQGLGQLMQFRQGVAAMHAPVSAPMAVPATTSSSASPAPSQDGAVEAQMRADLADSHDDIARLSAQVDDLEAEGAIADAKVKTLAVAVDDQGKALPATAP